MPNLITSKNAKQHMTRRELFDRIWTILVILGLVSMIGYSIVTQILHHP